MFTVETKCTVLIGALSSSCFLMLLNHYNPILTFQKEKSAALITGDGVNGCADMMSSSEWKFYFERMFLCFVLLFIMYCSFSLLVK